MNKLYNFSLILIGVLILLAFSSNPPNGHTGAPGELLCSNCHSGNAPIQGFVEINGLPDEIVPGMKYDLTVRPVVTNGNATRAGFQIVVLNSDNINAGSIAEPGSNVRLESFNSRTYAKHQPAKLFNGASEVTYNFTWSAPDSMDEDEISFYVVSVLANGNGSSTGDRVVNTRESRILKPTSTSLAERFSNDMFSLYPVPAQHTLHLDISEEVVQPISFTMFDSQGKMLQRDMYAGNFGIDIQSLQAGIYFLQLEMGGRRMVKRFIKG